MKKILILEIEGKKYIKEISSMPVLVNQQLKMLLTQSPI